MLVGSQPPFLEPAPHALLPEQELPVLHQPPREPIPASNDRLVSQFDRSRAVRRRIGDDEAGVGQGLHHALAARQTAQLRQRGAAAGVVAVLLGAGDLYQANEQLTRGVLLLGGQGPVYLLGARGNRSGQSADPVVSVVGERLSRASLPQPREGELEQRQCARLTAGVVEKAFGQSVVEFEARDSGWLGDCLRQLRAAHRRQVHDVVLQGVGEAAMREHVSVEVSPERDQDFDLNKRAAAGDFHQGVEEVCDECVLGAVGEQFLELVADDQQRTVA